MVFIPIIISIIFIYTNRVESVSECGDSTSTTVTYCDLDTTLRSELKIQFDEKQFHEDIGPFVRLIFHDCMGQQENDLDNSGPISICDGCIDFNNPAHSGIQELAVEVLEVIYNSANNNWWNRMSRSDFWAAAGTIAIQYAAELDGNADNLPLIPFYLGRNDCSASPNIDITKYSSPYKSFPEANEGWEHNFNWFNLHFGFDEEEYVAALGAHTLGRLHKRFSGFGTAPWVVQWDLLNNDFYKDLLQQPSKGSRDWLQIHNPQDQWQWDGSSKVNVVMINADMALIKNIDNHISGNDGLCTCTYDTCPDNTISKPFVQQYANDNLLWLNDFAIVFNKMILMGYNENDLELLPQPFTCDVVKVFQTFWRGVTDEEFDENNLDHVDFWLTRGENRFMEVAEHIEECGTDITNMSYFYQFSYNAAVDRLTLDMHVCCPEGKDFGDLFPDPF